MEIFPSERNTALNPPILINAQLSTQKETKNDRELQGKHKKIKDGSDEGKEKVGSMPFH